MGKYLYSEPLKMPRGKKYGSDYSIAYSSKLKRNVTMYSMLEYYYFLTLEMNPNVEYFCEQPCKIEFEVDGKVHHSVFDFWVYFKDNHSEYHEIKYAKELTGDSPSAIRSQNQIAHQKVWCNKNGCIYKVITNLDIIKSEYYIENLKSLQHRVSRYKIKDYDFYLEVLKEFIISSPDIVYIRDIIMSEILEKGKELDFLSYAFQNGDISLDIKNRPLDNGMEVTI